MDKNKEWIIFVENKWGNEIADFEVPNSLIECQHGSKNFKCQLTRSNLEMFWELWKSILGNVIVRNKTCTLTPWLLGWNILSQLFFNVKRIKISANFLKLRKISRSEIENKLTSLKLIMLESSHF